MYSLTTFQLGGYPCNNKDCPNEEHWNNGLGNRYHIGRYVQLIKIDNNINEVTVGIRAIVNWGVSFSKNLKYTAPIKLKNSIKKLDEKVLVEIEKKAVEITTLTPLINPIARIVSEYAFDIELEELDDQKEVISFLKDVWSNFSAKARDSTEESGLYTYKDIIQGLNNS